MTARAPVPGDFASPLWAALGAQWPNREASRVVDAGGLRWHVQVAGTGPALLLVHGTGAASHSWGGVLPKLARRFTVVAPDLPGHGFTSAPAPELLDIGGMANALARMLDAIGLAPQVVVGHSAGAAVALRMALDRSLTPAAVVGVNAALEPPALVFRALGSALFQPIAQSLGAARLAARVAESDWYMRRMLSSTGSRIGEAQLARYAAFTRSEPHVAALLAMLSRWDLAALARTLPKVRVPVTLLVGADDQWVPPETQRDAAARIPGARAISLPGLGHLAHEEAPELVSELVTTAAREAGVNVGPDTSNA